jgi:hypothetical protein
MQIPRVSVLMPAFNRQQFIGESIASVLAQRSVSLELIVIDDASTDATATIAEDWARRDPRVVVLRLPENRGASAALNAGLDVARGVYAARQDSDDVAMPDRLARQQAVLDADAGVALVGTDYLLTDSRGRPKAVSKRAESREVLRYLMNFGNALGIGGTGMFRTATVRALGGFTREFRLAQGYELWARLAGIGGIEVLPFIGVRYRVHGDAVSARFATPQKEAATEISRRTTSAFLGREVTRDEAGAVTTMWWGSPDPRTIDTARSLVTETFETLRTMGHPPSSVRRARVLTAERFAVAALVLAARGHVSEAARCMATAARWHPRSYAGLAWNGVRVRVERRYGALRLRPSGTLPMER